MPQMDLFTPKLPWWPITSSWGSAEASGIQPASEHSARSYWRSFTHRYHLKVTLNDDLFYWRHLHACDRAYFVWNHVPKETFLLWLWTKESGNTRGGFILNVVAGPCSSEFTCRSSELPAYSGGEGKEVNLMVAEPVRAINCRLTKTVLAERQDKDKQLVPILWEVKNPFVLETCRRLLAVARNNPKQDLLLPYVPQPFQQGSCYMRKSKPPSTLFRPSCRWVLRLLASGLRPSFPPPTLHSGCPKKW